MIERRTPLAIPSGSDASIGRAAKAKAPRWNKRFWTPVSLTVITSFPSAVGIAGQGQRGGQDTADDRRKDEPGEQLGIRLPDELGRPNHDRGTSLLALVP